MPIFQLATEYDNTETGDTTILILKKEIWMGETMDQTLLNPNQLRAYGMTVQDNPSVEAPIFIVLEDHEYYTWSYHKNPHGKRATDAPTIYLFAGS